MSVTFTYRIDGEELTEEQFRKIMAKRRRASGAPAVHLGLRHSKRLVSEAAAVHPDDRMKAEEVASRLGVPTHFDSQGRPEFTSFRHQRRYLRTQGLHNKRDIC